MPPPPRREPDVTKPGRPALFLDRDGVVNFDHGYVHKIENFDFLPGIFDLARFAAQELRWPIVVATNQAGIARGYYDEAAYETLTRWMRDRFSAEGAPLARVYHCPYHPTAGIGAYRQDHAWRKPRPGMFLAAQAELGLDLCASALIGDMPTDIEAGHAAGVGLLIKLPPAGAGQTRPPASGIAYQSAADLRQALALLRQATSR